MIIACAYFPRFFIQVKKKKDPFLSQKPSAIHLPSGRIIDVSQEAEKVGIRKGMVLKEAKSICPECIFITFDEEESELAIEGILKVLFSITPVIERDGHFFFLDVGHINEEETKSIGGIIKDNTGFEAKIGVASRKFLSKVASIIAQDTLLIPPGKEEEFLKDLPVDYLPVDEELKERLKLLGLIKIEDIQRLPQSFYRSFGKKGISLLRLLKGSDEEKINPIMERLSEIIQISFPVPEESIEAVLSEIDKALTGLDDRKVYPSRVRLLLRFIDKGILKEEFFIREEQASKDVILIRMRSFLENIKERGPLSEITLILSDLQRKRGSQLSLFTVRKMDLLSTVAFLRKKYRRGVIYEACNEALLSKGS